MSSHPTSIWKRSPNKLRQSEIWLDYLCVISLFGAALLLFVVNLGSGSLIDGDEALVAQVAKEIHQQRLGFGEWLLPDLFNKTYLERPNLIHILISGFYAIAGVNELTTRLPGAILGATSVLLLYNIGREIFVIRLPALFSALIYLTCLPVVRLGRLAMLDGPLLCFELLAIWAILRSRRDLRWTLVAGIALGTIGFTQSFLCLQIIAVALLFLAWDTPRLLASVYLWTGISLGLVPLVVWHAAQLYTSPELHNPSDAVSLLMTQVSSTTSLPQSSSWGHYLLFILQYSLPWLIVFLGGLKLAWKNTHWGWGKLVVIWIGVYLAIILILLNQQSWYILPLYPALALAGGAKLDQVYNLPSYISYPRHWSICFGIMAILTASMGMYFGFTNFINLSLPLIFGSLTLTFGATSVFINRRERQFIALLFWGLYVSCFFFVSSSVWIWESISTEPVKSLANLINKNVPSQEIIYTSWKEYPPSLNFYSDHSIVTEEITELKQRWQENKTAYLLVDNVTIQELKLTPQAILQPLDSQALNWVLASKNFESRDSALQ